MEAFLAVTEAVFGNLGGGGSDGVSKVRLSSNKNWRV